PLLFSRDDEIRVVLAIVAALAAVLLRHRGHHAPSQGTARGERHAFRHWESLIVPGRLSIVAIIERPLGDRRNARHQGGTFFRRKRRHAVAETEIPREKAVQPGALFG